MIHTIGHSNHPAERFIGLLRQHAIEVVADVRSTPYSRFNPQYGREKLQRALADAGIGYHFLGEELGARSQDPDCYDDAGRVVYAKLAATGLFRNGLQRLRTQLSSARLAIMCAERDPLECHRTILIVRELERAGVQAVHILHDGALEEHSQALQRLRRLLKLPDSALLQDGPELAQLAYDLQAKRIAYVKKPAGGSR